MNRLSLITGLTILSFFAIAALMAGGNLIYFVDIPSILFVLGITTGALWAAFGPTTTIAAIINPLISRPEPNPKNLAIHLNVLKQGNTITWAAGIFGTLAGLVLMLQNMDDPSKIGPGMAVAILCLLYAAVIAEFGFNLLHQITLNNNNLDSLTNNTQEQHNQPTTPAKSMLPKAAGAAMFTIMIFFIMLIAVNSNISEIEYKQLPGYTTLDNNPDK